MRTIGFSLVEMLTVIAVVALLLAFAAPNLAPLAPLRKTALYEVKGFLEYARSEAIARNREVYVAFADHSFPGSESPFRAYTAFAVTEDEDTGGLIETQQITPITEWRTLPEGIVFVSGSEFETIAGASLRTIMDSSVTREFPIRGAGGDTSVRLPFLLFSASGRVLVPSYFDADALHVGIAEGFFEPSGRNTTPTLTARRPGTSGSDYAQGECLAIEYYTGRTRTLTD